MCGHKFVIYWILSWTLNRNLIQAYEDFYCADGLNPVKEALDVWSRPRDARLAVHSNQPDCERPDIYICEEPPDILPIDLNRTCNYRNVNYAEQVYRWVAGWGCLFYTPDFLYVGGENPINMSSSCFYEHLVAPCVEIAKPDGTCGCYPFDPGLPEVVHVVENALLPSVHGRWERCLQVGKNCCDRYMAEQDTYENDTGCTPTFDGWSCWQGAEAGTIATQVCSEFAYSNVGPTCHHFSTKECFPNGSWELQTDYSTCRIAPRLLRRYRFHIAMLSFSIISCFPAVVIFFSYKRLRITRVALHRNLLIAIIVRNVLVIVSRTEIYIHELTNTGDTTLSLNSVWCRVLSTAERIAANAVFVCMLVEGIYLHRRIVAVFKKNFELKWIYVVGAVIAIAPVAAWAVVMGLYDNHSCWVVYTTGYVHWILDTPRIIILLINTFLFLHVMRVLLTKVRNSENANQLSTAKATLYLLPIFGIQFLLTAFRPNTTNCTGEQIYYYVAYTVEGLQGFIVAMLYCYVNKEVRMLIKATYKKTENFVSRVRRESTYPRTSTDQDRRLTYSTGLPSQSDAKHDYATIRPNLHVAEIISIQASERLADILEPIYETIDHHGTDGYASTERSDVDNGPALIEPKDPKVDEYYGFTNVSSVSMDYPGWDSSVSAPASILDGGRILPTHPKVQENELERTDINAMETVSEDTSSVNAATLKSTNCPDDVRQLDNVTGWEDDRADKTPENIRDDEDIVESSDYDAHMLDEIMQYIENNDNRSDINVNLDPDLLCPNRKEEDKVIFVDE